MSQSRKIALEAIYKVNEEGAFSNLVLNNLLSASDLSDLDKGLTTELVYGSIRYRNRLDWIINQFANQRVKDMTPWVRNALRLGVYQLEFLDRVPAHAACNETVEAAKNHCNKGAIGFINAILRNILRDFKGSNFPKLSKDPVQHIRYKYSFPQWIVENWVKEYGVDETIALAKKLNSIAETVIRTNKLKITTKDLVAKLEETGVLATAYSLDTEFDEAVVIKDFGSIEKLQQYQDGLFQVQGLSSMLVSHIVNPKPSDFIVDLCAGLGGKTTHLSQLMDNKGLIRAVDINEGKLKNLSSNCERLGISNVETAVGDGCELKLAEKADKILIDAPCSGFGAINKKPEIKWHRKPQDVDSLVEIQRKLLNNAAQLLKSGGELIYSTCTFNKEETEAVIENFLRQRDNFMLVDLTTRADELGVDSFSEEKHLKITVDKDFEGFFIAKLIKNNNYAGEKDGK